MEVLADLNWIDILVALIFVRCIYAGAARGIASEFFKLLGVFSAIVVTQHYYVKFAKFLCNMLFFPSVVSELLSFVLLWLIVFVVFKIVADGWIYFVKLSANPLMSKWGGIIFSIPRAFLVSALTLVLVFVAGNEYLVKNVRTSFVGFYLMDVSPDIYTATFDNFLSKFFPGEEKNEKLLKLLQEKKEDKTPS